MDKHLTSPSAFERAFYRFLQEVKVFLFLIDGSGSVPASGFKVMLNVVRMMANRIDNNVCNLGVFQYSTKVTPSCTPTSNIQQFHKALDEMVQDKQGNEEATALTACTKALKECPLSGKRAIIHVTDGGLMGHWKAASTEVKYKEKIDIMSIGVGEKIDAENIRDFATPGLAFFVKDYAQLQDMFQFLDLAPLPQPKLKPVLEKKIDARQVCLEVDGWPLLSETQFFHVEVYNRANLQWEHAATSNTPVIEVKKGIQPNKKRMLRVYAELKSGRVSPSSDEVTVVTPNGNPYSNQADNIETALQHKLQSLQEFVFCNASSLMELTKYMVLLAGAPGAGKTAILTAINTLIAGKYLPIGVMGEAMTTLTRVVTGLEELQSIILVDTPGITPTNLPVYEKYLYYGGLPLGYDERDPDMTAIRKVDQVAIRDQVHCVVLAVSCETLVDANLMEMLKKQYEIILKQGRNCLVLLTKVDKVDTRIQHSQPETLSLVWESGIVLTFRKSLATHLGISLDCIVPVVSYNAPMKPNPWISLLHLDWIEKALSLSDGFCSTFFAIEKAKRIKRDTTSNDDLMNKILFEKLKISGPASSNNSNNNTDTPVGTTTYQSPVVSPSSSPALSKRKEFETIEFLIRREEDPADDWSSIYLNNNEGLLSTLHTAVCNKYPPRSPSSIAKLVEIRKIGNTTINKRIETDQDVSQLLHSAAQGNTPFLVVSFAIIYK